MLPRRRNYGRSRRRCLLSLNRLLSRLFISWETEVFNESLFNWGVRYSRYLKPWFSLGVGLGLTAMMMTVLVMLLWVSSLFVDLRGQNTSSGTSQESRQIVTLVVPGINVPWSDFPYMISAMTFAVGFHELGHAIAAASEGVPIEHVAVFLACLVPGALIALNEESLQLLSPVRALRIYCAGIWHNVVCCTGCYLLLMLFPVILYPFYFQSQNPLVLDVDSKSPLAGHLRPGDSILEVAGLQLHSPEHWVEFLHGLHVQELSYSTDTSGANLLIEDISLKSSLHIATQGFCVFKENYTKHHRSLHGSACSKDALLFYEVPCAGTTSASMNSSQAIFCLKATDVVKCPTCSRSQKSEFSSHPCRCSENSSCLLPILDYGEVLINIKLQQSSLEQCTLKVTNISCQQSLVFVGFPKDLFHCVQLTKYWPRQLLLFGLFAVSSWGRFPNVLERLLTYTFSISAAMALLNSAPVFYLDGEAIFQTLLLMSKSFVHPKKHKRVMQILLTIGTVLLIFFLVSGFHSMVLSK